MLVGGRECAGRRAGRGAVGGDFFICACIFCAHRFACRKKSEHAGVARALAWLGVATATCFLVNRGDHDLNASIAEASVPAGLVCTATGNTDNPLRADAPPASRASARGSAVMPRPSTGSQSGDVEMSQAEPREPSIDLTSVYVDRPSEVGGVNDARVPSDTAAVAKRTSRTPGSL